MSNITGLDPQDGLAKKALNKIRELQRQLDARNKAVNEPIAIIGVGCRFPGDCQDLAGLWKLLSQEICTVTEVPADRWANTEYYDAEPGKPGKMYSRHGSFLKQIDAFDPLFFSITPREARLMDPQQRLLLEVCWEAMENAYLPPSHLKGTATGVFIGAMTQDYSHFISEEEASDFYATTGNANSVLSGRISYLLGLQGPTMTIDTACSSSLVAVHLACQSLRNNECKLALAGGVNLQLSPFTTIAECAGQMLSPEGICKVFDEAADGFVRGEGCGVIILKKLSAAIADKDNILSVILGSAVNHDGASGGLTVPNGPAQEKVIHKALAQANVSPRDVDYIEAHGTGTRLGDPIELKAIQATYGKEREKQLPVYVGSIKSNIGHTEAAAGIAGILKIIASMHAGQIPASLHLKIPNRQIPWQDIPFEVPTHLISWKPSSKNKIAAISSFGLSGTNAHLIMQQAPHRDNIAMESAQAEKGYLLPISAMTETALSNLIRLYREHLLQLPTDEYKNFCLTAAIGREHFSNRKCFWSRTSAELIQQLNAESSNVIHKNKNQEMNLAFIFPDEDTSYIGMGKTLYTKVEIFRFWIDKCNQLFLTYWPQELTSILWKDDADQMNKSCYARAGTFCFQYALAQTWIAWGVVPEAVLGLGVGEITAACVGGKLNLEDAIHLLATSRLEQAKYHPAQLEIITASNITQAAELLSKSGMNLCLQISSMPVEIPTDQQNTLTYIATINHSESGVAALQEAVSRIYELGGKIDWQRYASDEEFDRISLPYYPFQRESFWVDSRIPLLRSNTSDAVSNTALIKKIYPYHNQNSSHDLQTVIMQTREVIASLMRLDHAEQVPVDQPLNQWGMNSLMSIELQKEISVLFSLKLPSTLMFDYPTVNAIANYVYSILAGNSQEAVRVGVNQQHEKEDIAIIGMACRFPGAANSLEEYWRILVDGTECITDGMKTRWYCENLYNKDRDTLGSSYSFHAGLLDQINEFDAGFFDISPREAKMMDPQQRITLEVVWHALENAGYTGNALSANTTGIFMGVAPNEYARLCERDAMHNNYDAAFMPTGNSVNAIPGRVAYQLGLEGPCMAIDTACSSSLVALHTACQSLRDHECDMALAGGINLLISSTTFVPLAKAGMLSTSGRCHTFSANADGFVRAEGCGVLVLKRLSAARDDHDNILAIIKGTAINQDGRSSSLTAPSGSAQQKVMYSALQRGKIHPSEVQWIEAHGTGTPLGDPIEIRAIDSVYGVLHTADSPLFVSSVKTNLGHTEVAAGMASLIKVVLSMQHEKILPHLHLDTVNPHIDVDLSRIVFPDTIVPWPRGVKKRIAAVSSFGFTGTNAHIILEEPPIPLENILPDQPHVLTLSAKSRAALLKLAHSYILTIKKLDNKQFTRLCYSSNFGRAHFKHRLAITGKDIVELETKLKTWIHEQNNLFQQNKQRISNKPTLAFVFSGYGAHYINMGKDYYDADSEFKNAVDACAALFDKHLEKPLLSTLWGENTLLLGSIHYSLAAIFSIQIGLVHLWRKWGINPDVVLGAGVGEYAAAYTAGVFTLESAVSLIVTAAQLTNDLNQNGRMLTVFTDEETVRASLKPFDQISIAAINAPQQIVISGCASQLMLLEKALDNQNIHYLPVNVSHALNSCLMQPILSAFHETAKCFSYQRPIKRFISSTSGQYVEQFTERHWVSLLHDTICFDTAIDKLLADKVEIVVEIGPSNVLTNGINKKDNANNVHCVASMTRQTTQNEQVSKVISVLYEAGYNIHWLKQNISQISLPTYPFEPNVYWPERTTKELDSNQPWMKWFYEIVWYEKKAPSSASTSCIQMEHPELKEQVLSHVTVLPHQTILQRYYHGINELELLSIDYIVNAFVNMIEKVELSSHWTGQDLIQKLEILPKYSALFNQLLDSLLTVGVLLRKHGKFSIVQPLLRRDVDSKRMLLQKSSPEIQAELKLLARCGAVLEQVLRGHIDALEILFMEEDIRLVEEIYQNSPGQKALNEQLAATVSSLLNNVTHDSGKSLRILEIGAGTGGATAHLLPILPKDRISYVYTDISTSLLQSAKTKFSKYSFIEYKIFDVEKDSISQGLDAHSFDLIIAANVIHATKDLTESLETIKKLLLPNGRLLLIEAMHQFNWLSLTFGLTDGWWRFHDKQLRKSSPLLTSNQWEKLLEKTGFIDTTIISNEENPLQGLLITKVASTQTIPLSEWVIFADDQGYADELLKHLTSQEIKYYLVKKSDNFIIQDQKTYLIRPGVADDYAKLSQAIGKKPDHNLRIVHLWSLDIPDAKDINEDVLRLSAEFGFGSAFFIAQEFSLLSTHLSTKLWCVTKQAQAVTPSCQLSGVAQSSIWGAGKSIISECPDFFGGIIDIESMMDVHSVAEEINKFVVDEEQIVFRNGKRYVPRLEPANDEAQQKVMIHEDATYLITGGLGGIGLETCQWLVTQGAKNIILCGRSAASQEAMQFINVLQENNVRIKVVQADVGKRADVEKVLQSISLNNMPSLKGLFHSAGVGGHQLIADIRDCNLDETLQPKILGGWWLHELTASLSLDLFVAYSSMVSIWGTKGQARYVVANQFIDTLMHYRQRCGLPGLSINWAPWKDTGMLISRGEELANQAGISSLETKVGLKGLATILTKSKAQILFAQIDWGILLEVYQLRKQRKLFEFFKTSSKVIASNAEVKLDNSILLDKLEKLSLHDRLPFLVEFIQREITVIMDTPGGTLPDPDEGFFSLGMESLMAIQLKNRINQQLGINILSTVIFNYASASKLAKYLMDEVLKWSQSSIKSFQNKLDPPQGSIELLIENELAMLEKLTEDHHCE